MTDPIFKGTEEQLTNAAEEMLRRAKTNTEKTILRALMDERKRLQFENEFFRDGLIKIRKLGKPDVWGDDEAIALTLGDCLAVAFFTLKYVSDDE